MSYNIGFSRKLGNTLLTIMFLMVMIISCLSITSSYSSLQLSIQMLDVTYLEISRHLQEQTPLNKDGNLSPALEAFRKQLKSDTSGVLESSTISFLFTILSLTLVTAGVYLLSRAHSNIIQAENKLSLASQQVSEVSVVSAMEGHIILAHHASFLLLDASTESSTANSIANLRGKLTTIKNSLSSAHQSKIGIHPLLHKLLLDQVITISANIISRTDIADRLSELIIVCQDCVDILDDSKFVERYGAQNSQLQAT
ncbi:MAG: hypothetical protein GY865_15030 [candidate division Zixibacteria bacterium]|nr:hypothetical protein [candidate division Zixibacteria bacterium]